jgi:hypothetical protein
MREKSEKSNMYAVRERVSKTIFEQQPKAMCIIKCDCGTRILVVPDLKAMNHAINRHLTKHKNTQEREYIEQLLTEKILKAIIKIGTKD